MVGTTRFEFRRERIRTSDPLNPIQVRYQAALHAVKVFLVSLEIVFCQMRAQWRQMAFDERRRSLLSVRVEVGFASIERGEQVAQLFGKATHG